MHRLRVTEAYARMLAESQRVAPANTTAHEHKTATLIDIFFRSVGTFPVMDTDFENRPAGIF